MNRDEIIKLLRENEFLIVGENFKVPFFKTKEDENGDTYLATKSERIFREGNLIYFHTKDIGLVTLEIREDVAS